MKISYSFGIVDLLHFGHINTLLEAKNDSDLHIFGLVSDEAVIDWVGTIVSNYEERKRVLENVSCIDEIMFQKTLDPLENIKKIHQKYPNAKITLYHGDNWKIMPSEDYLKSINGEVVFTRYYDKLTPEKILKLLNKRKITMSRKNNIISTKANTLLALKNKLTKSSIEDIFVLTVEEFEKNNKLVWEKIKKQFSGNKIVIRSSSSNEDCYETSNAGHYESFLNIDSSCYSSVCNAIKKVIDSYKKDSLYNKTEQVLVQSQTLDVDISGVVFTRDINENRPYYVINYDDQGSTDYVTSGLGGKTIWISHDIEFTELNPKWRKLMMSIVEIEELLKGMVLDIEFAIKKSGEVVIFQVRPLAASYKYNYDSNDKQFLTMIGNERNKYKKTIINQFDNSNMMLSDMAFWNPSEIIGDNPRNLDYSLYREIITKNAWNEGLVPLGYTKVNKELMYKIGNKPYISLDYSFMSLIPSVLNENLRNKLISYYKEKLKGDPTAHDKIEFEIVISCYDFNTEKKLEELLMNGFTIQEIDEIKHSLYKLTKEAYKEYCIFLEKDLASLKTLECKREKIQEIIRKKEVQVYELLDYLKELIRYIVQYGTPQFSRQARFAFMSQAICKSLVTNEYVSKETMDIFLQSIQTVASDFEKDFHAYINNQLSREEFNQRYGHLRSNTYDIRTPRYDQIEFNTNTEETKNIEDMSCNEISSSDQIIIENILNDLGFGIRPDTFVQIIKSSLEQRELFKFEFTKSLSLALEMIILIGKKLNIDKKNLSYLEIPDIYAAKYYDTEEILRDFWMTVITQRKLIYKEKSKIILPEVIIEDKDINCVEMGQSRPNFITNKAVVGEVVVLDEEMNEDIQNKIVVISKADPGYDWIFTKGIKGLITKYGGVASHMAIRCAEFGIPAAIGCGEKIYNHVKTFSSIVLNCKEGKIEERR